jgi:hypothetical protein
MDGTRNAIMDTTTTMDTTRNTIMETTITTTDTAIMENKNHNGNNEAGEKEITTTNN